MRDLTIGTHNLHDQAGRPSPFADIVLFTEADPTRLRRTFTALRGWTVVVCRQQPDLAVAHRRRLFKLEGIRYRRAHEGAAKVTPHRGTWVLDGILAGRDATLIVEHRINAAFPPYRRGEAAFRTRCWQTHTEMTLDLINEARAAGQLVIAGGDLNTPRGVSGYRGVLDEVGRGFDRLGVTAKGTRLHSVAYLGNAGSDHPRLRAELVIA